MRKGKVLYESRDFLIECHAEEDPEVYLRIYDHRKNGHWVRMDIGGKAVLRLLQDMIDQFERRLDDC